MSSVDETFTEKGALSPCRKHQSLYSSDILVGDPEGNGQGARDGPSSSREVTFVSLSQHDASLTGSGPDWQACVRRWTCTRTLYLYDRAHALLFN